MSESNADFVVEEIPDGQTTPPPAKNLDDELSQYSEGVQKRINDEVAKSRALERELQETKSNLARAADIARRAVNEAVELRGRVGKGEEAVVDNLVSSLTSELELAKADLRKAHEEGDAGKIADATANVSSKAADLRRAEVAKAGLKMDRVQDGPDQGTQPQGQPPAPPPRQAQPPVNPKAQAWIAANSSWFGKDQEKTRVAIAADAFVRAMNFDPNSDDYYKEVDKVISSRLNGGTPDPQPRDPRGPAQASTPAGRSSAPVGNGVRKVSLTQSEVATARRLGLTNEQYAASKLAGNVVL